MAFLVGPNHTGQGGSLVRRAALFDMDRTLVRVETASLYVKYQRKLGEATLLDLAKVSWWAFLYTFNLIDAPAVAQKVFLQLRGSPEINMSARCDDWFHQYVEPHVCDAGRCAVRSHQAQGDLVAIVTGATPYASRPLARLLGIEHVLATNLEVKDGCFTGGLEFPMCFGDGKVCRAKTLLEQHGLGLTDATFYSDSITDLPLLEAVGEPVIINPDPPLARIAKKRGWRIERW